MAKLDANIRAITILKDLEKDSRLPNEDEKFELSNYTGWGALSHAFDPYYSPFDQRKRWLKANEDIKALMSLDELAAARRSTMNAHYTAPEIVRYMWDIMKQLGFTGGNVLEPSMGTGNFLGMMPKAMRGNVNGIGNEMDPTTAGISRYLCPGATILNQGLERPIRPDNVSVAVQCLSILVAQSDAVPLSIYSVPIRHTMETHAYRRSTQSS